MGISPAVLRSAFISLETSARPGLLIQSALPGSIEVFFLFFFSFSLTPYMPLADIIWPVVVEIPVCAPCLCSFFFFFFCSKDRMLQLPGEREAELSFHLCRS